MAGPVAEAIAFIGAAKGAVNTTADLVNDVKGLVSKFQQHNTTIANDSSRDITFKLTCPQKSFPPFWGTIGPRRKATSPTPHGDVSVYVFDTKNPHNNANASDESDTSFLVQQTGSGNISVVASRYRYLWEPRGNKR